MTPQSKTAPAPTMTSRAATVLAWAGLAYTVAWPMIALVVRGDVAAPGSVPWRFAVLGMLLFTAWQPAAGLGLAALAGQWKAGRGTLAAVGFIASLLGVFLLVSVVLFALDALQMRSLAPPDKRGMVLIQSAITIAIGAGSGVVLGWLGFAAIRAAMADRPPRIAADAPSPLVTGRGSR